MKNFFWITVFLFFIAFVSKAQGGSSKLDSVSRKTALAVCNCLSQQDLDKITTEQEMQQVFLKCILDSANGAFSDVLQTENTEKAGEELGKKLATDLINVGCSSFMKLAVKMAGAGENKDDVKEQPKYINGTVINVEEKDFLYVVVKSSTNREYRFIYLSYVPGSDKWTKNTTFLRGKKVSIEWIETEVFQPKVKEFVKLKQIKKLTLE